MIPNRNPNRPSDTFLPVLLWGVLLFCYALRPIEDFDTFWQLQSGKYIWQSKSFIYTDIFSLAAEAFRLEHCWLSDLIFYGLYSLGGFAVLNLLKPLSVLLYLLLLWRWNALNHVPSMLALPILTLCLIASEPSWLLRPQLWTFALSLVYLQLLYQGRKKGLRAWLWLPPLMLLWANLHAACVFGFALIGLFGCGELLRALRRKTPWRQVGELGVVGLLTLAASFINPYGYRIPAILFGFINLHDVELPTMTGNMEWLPPIFSQTPLFYVVMILWGVLILMRWRRLDPTEAIFFTAFLYMGLSMIRHTTLVSLLAGFFLPGAVWAVVQPWLDGFNWRRYVYPLLQWGTTSLIGVLVLSSTARGELGLGLRSQWYPTAAADFILTERLPGNLYNAYDWGGYLMWRLYPDYLVFVDGRQDSVEMFLASNVVDEAQQGWQKVLDDNRVNTLITRTCYFDTGGPLRLISALSTNSSWALVFRDEVSAVYVRRSAVDQRILSHELPAKEVFRTMRSEAARLYADDPVRSRALLSMGRAAVQLGEFAAARQHYAEYVKRVPDDQDAATILRLLNNHGEK